MDRREYYFYIGPANPTNPHGGSCIWQTRCLALDSTFYYVGVIHFRVFLFDIASSCALLREIIDKVWTFELYLLLCCCNSAWLQHHINLPRSAISSTLTLSVSKVVHNNGNKLQYKDRSKCYHILRAETNHLFSRTNRLFSGSVCCI